MNTILRRDGTTVSFDHSDTYVPEGVVYFVVCYQSETSMRSRNCTNSGQIRVRDVRIIEVMLEFFTGHATGGEGFSFGPPLALGCTPPGVPLHLPRLQAAAKDGLKGVKVGLYPAWFNDADASIVGAASAAVDILKQAGAEVIEISIPDLELCRVAHTVTLSSDSLQVRTLHPMQFIT
jgi:Asp-tRNA(Asn)/Glu-tRNA(Gln) amidotransferase A subunit family amidase